MVELDADASTLVDYSQRLDGGSVGKLRSFSAYSTPMATLYYDCYCCCCAQCLLFGGMSVGRHFFSFSLFSLLPSLAFGVGNWTLGRQSRRSPAPVPSRFDGCCVISWCETLQQGRCLGRLGRESRWRGKYQGYDVNRAINSSDEESEDGEREGEKKVLMSPHP